MINPIDFVFDYLEARQTIATLTAERDAARAERDAALARVAALEAQCATCDHKAKGTFYFDMVQADEAWRKAQRGRVTP